MMFTYVVSRLVLLLFACSFLLVVSRYLFDKIARKSSLVARWVVIGIIVISCFLLFPLGRRSTLIILAKKNLSAGNWESADRQFVAYREAGGRLSQDMRAWWTLALVNLQRFSDAEEILRVDLQHQAGGPQKIRSDMALTHGVCQYYLGNKSGAEATFLSFPVAQRTFEVEYFVGRIREYQAPDQALSHYQKSLAERPCLYPALYSALRLAARLGRDDVRAGLIGACSANLPHDLAEDPLLRRLMTESASGLAALPNREFYLVFR